MKKTFTKLSLTILGLLIIQVSVAQKVYTSSQLNTNTDVIEKFNGTKGNEAFCMVTGGTGGPTGWAKFYLEDPTSFEILAPKPSGIYFMGGDFGPDGTWYCTEWMGGFYSTDTSTGEHIQLATLSEALSGFTYSPSYETFFCCTGGELFTMNIETYELTSVGLMVNSGNMTGLGADIRGNLYGIDISDDKLYKIDPVTGLATAVGPSGFDFDYMQNCTYDKNMDIMYHAGFWVVPSSHGGLFTFDLETGSASELTAFPLDQEVVSFAIPWTMPEHGSISGEVSDAATGDPVADVEIYLVPEDPLGTNIYKITGQDGLYSFGVVLPGMYEITAVSANYGAVIVDDIVVNVGDNLTIDIELQVAPWSATFHVYTFEGSNPIEGAEVNFVNQTLLTNAQGEVVFEDIANGTYEYTVDIDGYYQGFGDVEVLDDDVEVDVYMYEDNNVQVNLVVIEEATGTWCGPCGQVAPLLDQLYDEGYPISIIAYHATDDYENSYSIARNGYYGVIAYPTLTFNGQDQCHNESYDVILNYVEEYMDDETLVTLGFTDMAQNISNNTITGKVAIENLGPINSDHMRLQVALVENHIPEQWQGLSELNFVERTMFPDEHGTSIDLTTITTEEIEIEVPLDDILELENCQIVAFVQDNFTKKIHNGLIYECSTLVGVDENIAAENINVFPNPANNKVMISASEEITKIQLINYSGQLVLDQQIIGTNTELNLSELGSGIYFIKVFSQNNVITRKLVIE
nr:carboxypeptidase regulatory-like domain-containing protein [Bacteroidota bacterium]